MNKIYCLSIAMNYLKFLYPLFFFELTLTYSNSSSMAKSDKFQAVKGGYWPSWDLNFPPSAINTSYFTHIYYAFLSPNNVTFEFNLSSSEIVSLKSFTSTLHNTNHPVKAIFSVGGGSEEAAMLFSRMASKPASRKNFIRSSIKVAREFGFDGVDLDWEYPTTPTEMQNLGHLLHEWRAEAQKEATKTGKAQLLIVAAVYYKADINGLGGPYRAYPISSMAKNLDWVNAMCYDYHGSWDKSATGVHAALFDPTGNLSTSYGLSSWIKAGLPPSKLIMGIPLYGRTWQLKDSRDYTIGSPAVDVGPGQDGQGTLTYAEVEAFNKENDSTVVHDVDTISAYSFSGTSWIGYDDDWTSMVKVGYAQGLGLRGYFFWAVNGDYNWKISKQASKLWVL